MTTKFTYDQLMQWDKDDLVHQILTMQDYDEEDKLTY